MWRLYREDGTLFRDGFPSQWEAVRTAKREDGTSFKKAEALKLKSGTEVYRQYYFFDMSEREIAKFCNLSRTTVQSRRTSSMKLLKRYLEEKAYDCTD